MREDEIVFTPDDKGHWIAVTDKGKISVNVCAEQEGVAEEAIV